TCAPTTRRYARRAARCGPQKFGPALLKGFGGHRWWRCRRRYSQQGVRHSFLIKSLNRMVAKWPRRPQQMIGGLLDIIRHFTSVSFLPNTLIGLVARGGIEPPTRGFSNRCRMFWGLNNQPLAALASPLPSHTKAHSWHTRSEFDTILAHHGLAGGSH